MENFNIKNIYIMKKLLLILVLAFLGIATLNANQPGKKVKGIRHIVLVKFKENTTPQQIAHIDTLVWKMKNEIKAIHKLEWGKRMGLSGESDEYDYCLNIIFKSELDLTMYEEHPAHKKLKAAVIPLISKITRFNYEIKK
jgi:hypothetical protein